MAAPELSLPSSRPAQRLHACRICAMPVRHSFADLGVTPPCESFVPADKLDDMEPFYPLHAFVCESCFLVQINEYVPPESIFSEYAYFSSYSTSWVEHARRYCVSMTNRLGLGEESLVVELASNDGYLLKHFGPLRVPVLGIEPAANVAAVAEGLGIPTVVDFFGVTLAEKLLAKGIRADLIVGNNVLAQVPNLNDFMGGIALLLKETGTVTLEFPHLQTLIQQNQFDQIYHEHFSYFSASTVQLLASRHGLTTVDIEELPTHGGSLRIYLAPLASGRKPTAAVAEMFAREEALGFSDLATYERFAENVRRTKRNILSFLINAKNSGRRVCGYGAPGKGNTLLNYCGIGTDFLDFTVDRNPYKHGRYTPGMRIPIRPVEAIAEARPDYVMILPWNLKDEIVQQMRFIGDWGGKFVVPIPEITVIDPRELTS